MKFSPRIAIFVLAFLFVAASAYGQIRKPDPFGTNTPPPEAPILDLAGQPIPGGGNGTYQQYTVNFVASSSNTVITFAFRDDPARVSMANASVTDTNHPLVNLLVNGGFSGGSTAPNPNDPFGGNIPNSWTYFTQPGAPAGDGAFNAPGTPGSNLGAVISCFLSNNGYCYNSGAVQGYDGISQTISGLTVGDTYQISFSVAENSNCQTSIGGPAISPCNFSDVSTNGDVTDPSGNGINVAVYVSPRNVALSVPTSGALLTIIGTLQPSRTPVTIYRYDSQIHSGAVAAVPLGTGISSTGASSNCNSTDQLYPTDAYRLQGSSWTGCDGGEASEVTDSNPGGPLPGMVDIMPNNQEGAGFHVETHYCANGSPCVEGTTINGMGQTCNTNMTVCANPDTGFVSVTNKTGQAFTGTITLSGNQTISTTASPYCPMAPSYPINGPGTVGAGAVLDSVVSGLGNTDFVVLSMGGDSSACSGFNAPQIALLQNGATFQYNIGKDYVQFKPSDSCSNNITPPCSPALHPEYLKVLPIPVPAGPLGSAGFGPFGPFGGSPTLFNSGEFGQEKPVLPTAPFLATSFPTQACVPIASFSANQRDPHSLPIAGATLNPACSDLEFDCVLADGITACGDAETFTWDAFLGFTVDPIVGSGIGGTHFLTQHRGTPAGYNGTCPTTGFTLDTLVYYLGAPPGVDFPEKKGNSCFADTYEPGTAPLANGAIAFNGFDAFQSPVSNCPTAVPPAPQPICSPQPENAGKSIPLKFLATTSGQEPITNLQECTDASKPIPPNCSRLPGVGTPAMPGTSWVWMGYSQINCGTGALIGTAHADAAGASGFQNLGPAPNGNGTAVAGTYTFAWKTLTSLTGLCATPYMVFSFGPTVFGVAEFHF
jgi:hypothetical protein